MAKKSESKKYVRYFWIIAMTPLLLLALFFTYLSVFADLPSLEELENPKSNLASEIISSDQKVLGKYYIENRTNISFENLSPNVVNALVATEDARFYRHSGVDFRALGRSVFGALTGRDNTGGASTITQQLAKMLFPREKLNRFSIVFRKLKEWIIAVRLERNYTKDEIIAMYLNKFDFINNAVGIKSAARIYFNTTPDSLKMEQAAMLVGMAKNPSLFNPIRKPKNALERRNVVLRQLMKYDYITETQYDSLKQIKLKINYHPEDQNEGIATYFREFLRDYMKDWCKANKKPDGSNYNLYKDGLKIYTTINSRMQQYAEQSVNEWLGKELQEKFFKHWKGVKGAPFYRMNQKDIDHLMLTSMRRSERYRVMKKDGISEDSILLAFNKPVEMTVFSYKGEFDTVMTPMDSMRYYKYFLQSGFMSMDPHTGYIKAWVGGINYSHFKYDHVKMGKRQVGSTFKPFVYALAMQEGWSPCYQVPNIPVTFDLPEGGTWSPKNSDGKYGGMMTLKKGLATSTNSITAYVMKQFGPQAVVDLATKMGIQSHLDAVPSLCLGTCDISLYEMVGANATFANQGEWIEPMFITRIEDKNGNVLQEFMPKHIEALSEETAYLTLNLMKGVCDFGTGTRLRFRYGLRNPIAGKTGTTQNNSDGWFMGITPDLVSGAWVGAEDRSVHFRSTDLGQGASMALPIFGLYMQKVYADKTLKISQGDFEKPAGMDLKVETDCSKYNEKDDEEETIEFGDEFH
ncbi:MAG TPA: transglycosylase domain-containing protein [Bacteroidia bacterium]|nr:transglycosylase domain-containing protein [Bacteroidia bacterium]HRH07509.1 transglycosylase domain-containing protein [Bacteroidia bacterium]